ncbi:hypothetical protein Pst134EA_015154 [Puccinia striiformis f. sp. tritici]|uniref:hypothetical protein n=1 Tax=Puccinia striiformis f. sp. tritici TaxID=168172 RepID=UPI0020073D06|nr:hypothetical protein Pst134EA_015154 [Puccinia striiformis f. sp. tritici]KAH9463067.1 hypothetical protein Pst134EA_015154 [Puccinia striiformis f. sp. tritici]
MVGPPLTAERKAYLASLPKPPPEMPDDEVAALEIVQTDMDLAENAPEVFSGSAHAASGGSHHDDDRSMAWNAAFDHHGPISGHEHHDIDEALAWAISREENGPHPVHAATHNHHQGHTWGGHDPSEDLALALSLHEELNREALGGAFPAGPSHAAIPEPEHELYMVPDTSRDADLAQRIQAEFSGGAFAAGPSHAAIPEPEHELYMVPDTSRDADLALRIQAQLNEEAQPIPQISSQSRHHGNSQPIPPGFPHLHLRGFRNCHLMVFRNSHLKVIRKRCLMGINSRCFRSMLPPVNTTEVCQLTPRATRNQHTNSTEVRANTMLVEHLTNQDFNRWVIGQGHCSRFKEESTNTWMNPF